MNMIDPIEVAYDEYVEWENGFAKNMAIYELQTRLADMGCAVVVLTPDDLRGVDPVFVEDRLLECGWEIIDNLVEVQENV